MSVQPTQIALTEEEHEEELRQMAVSTTLVPGDVFRAQVILMLADERSYGEIQQLLSHNHTKKTIARWKKRCGCLESRV